MVIFKPGQIFLYLTLMNRGVHYFVALLTRSLYLVVRTMPPVSYGCKIEISTFRSTSCVIECHANRCITINYRQLSNSIGIRRWNSVASRWLVHGLITHARYALDAKRLEVRFPIQFLNIEPFSRFYMFVIVFPIFMKHK